MATARTPSPFLEQVRTAISVRHYRIRTEEAYLFWTRGFILYLRKRHPSEMGEAKVGGFLSHLATDRNVSSSDQKMAVMGRICISSRSWACSDGWNYGKRGCRGQYGPYLRHRERFRDDAAPEVDSRAAGWSPDQWEIVA